MKNSSGAETKHTHFLYFLIIVFLVLPIFFVFHRNGIFLEFLSLKLSEQGDALAGIFSPMAFTAAVIALLLQSKELAQSRAEAAKSAVALSSQSLILEKREKGEEFEELLVSICSASSLDQVSWIFHSEDLFHPGQLRNIEVKLGFIPSPDAEKDELLEDLCEHLVNVSENLNEYFQRYDLPENPRVWSGYSPTELFELSDRICNLYPELSSAKQQRFKNLRIQELRDALFSLVSSNEWWRG